MKKSLAAAPNAFFGEILRWALGAYEGGGLIDRRLKTRVPIKSRLIFSERTTTHHPYLCRHFSGECHGKDVLLSAQGPLALLLKTTKTALFLQRGRKLGSGSGVS